MITEKVESRSPERRVWDDFHINSHRSLVHNRMGLPTNGSAMDTLIVPTSRASENLGTAIATAQKTNSRLIVLCSKESSAEDVTSIAGNVHGLDWLAIDVAPDYTHDLLEFETSKFSSIANGDKTDLSTKRNLGLLLSRLAGSQRSMFLDDDINTSTATVSKIASTLDRFDLAGCYVDYFPDNSVVCHGLRKAGGNQKTFLSGAILGFKPQEPLAFFPEVYNEDWLFMSGSVQERATAVVGFADQKIFNPFQNQERAADEEFGDFFAEALFTRFHRGGRIEDATQYSWESALGRRRRFIETIMDSVSINSRDTITGSLESSLRSLNSITPTLCHDYFDAWRFDNSRWRTTFAALPSTTVPDALDYLGLADSVKGNLV